MDIISEKLKIDPVDLRLKNCLDQGDETPAGDQANHIALRDYLLKVSAELKRWKKHAPANHGFGVALLHKSPTTSAAPQALLRMLLACVHWSCRRILR